jgi:hypothetical protein
MKIVGFVLCISIIGCGYSSAQSNPGSPIVAWSADVVLGVTGARNSSAPLLRDANRAGTVFIDEKRLLTYEVDVDTGQFSSRKNPSTSSPFRLRASVLDASSGKIMFTKDWETSIRGSSVNTVKDGILVRAGTMLRLLTKDFAEVQNVTLSEEDRGGTLHWDLWIISVSPTGKTVMVNRINQKANVSRFDVLDGDSFKLRCSWIESPGLYNSYSISDIAIATTEFHPPPRVLLSEFASRMWKPVGSKSKEGSFGVPTMLNNDQLFLQVGNQLSILSTDGRSHVLYELDKTETLDQRIALSQDGGFAAMSLNTFEVKKHILSETTWREFPKEILVYNLSLKKCVLTVDVNPLPKNDYDFALSSDGSKLAVLNDRKVSVYTVPVQPAKHTNDIDQKNDSLHPQVQIIPAPKPNQ